MLNLVDQIATLEREGEPQMTPKDFKADIDVRWCAGCGGYAILSQTQKIMPQTSADWEIKRDLRVQHVHRAIARS